MEGPNLAQKPTGSWVYTGARRGVLPPFCSPDDSSSNPDSSSSPFSYPCTYVGAPRTYANSRYSSASTYISAHRRAKSVRFNGKHWSYAVNNRHDATLSPRLSSARVSFRGVFYAMDKLDKYFRNPKHIAIMQTFKLKTSNIQSRHASLITAV